MRTAAVLVMLVAACGTNANPPPPTPPPPVPIGSAAPAASSAPLAASAEPAPRGPLVLDDVVVFPPDVATPGPQIAPILDTIAAKLRDRPDVRIEIAGHCNDREMVEVAYARANLVASGLAARGVPRTRVHVESYGNLRPLAPNTTEEGRAKNRRVDFRVVTEGAE